MHDEEQGPDPKLLRDLDDMSVDDLRDRITELKAEIALMKKVDHKKHR